MEANNQYILKWREHVLKAAEALKNHDYETYEAEINEMENTYDEIRRNEELSYNDENTFGAANAMFESALYNLYLENKPAIKEFMTTIKEDKNLYAQFMFYNTLKKYKKGFDKDKYLHEAIELASKNINYKTVKESNEKLYNIIRKHNIKPTDFLNEEDLHFYRLCESLFTNPKSLKTLAQLNETFNEVSTLLESRTNDIFQTKTNDALTIKEFTEKYNKILTEEEKKFINIMLNSDDDENRKRIYEEFKTSCIEKIKSMLTESTNNTTDRLNSLLESLSNKTYNRSTVLNDIIKIMEINEILDN